MLLVTRNWTELTILISWRKIHDIAQHYTWYHSIRNTKRYIVPVFNRHIMQRTKRTQHRQHIVRNACNCFHNYGRPRSVSGRPCYILPMFFYFFFLWPPYSPALVNGSSRKFYTWWTLSGIRELTTWIFSCSSWNYRVGQKMTKFGVFSDSTRKLSAVTPERGRIF